MWRVVGVSIFAILIWFICYIAIFISVPDFDTDTNTGVVLGLMMIGLLPAAFVYFVFLALLGTMLPAVAVLQDASFGRALITGRAAFWRTYRNLLLGKGAFTLVSALCLGIIDRNFGWFEDAVLVYLATFLMALIWMIGLLLSATALCIAYESGQSQQAKEARV